MTVAFTVTLSGNPRADIQRVVDGLSPRVLQPLIGRVATKAVQAHLTDLELHRPNALGGARTHFYGDAAGNTHFDVVGDHVVVSINSVGIAQRYFGGTIAAKNVKYLTIPARSESYGKRVSEFPSSELEVLFGRNGPYAIARRVSQGLRLRRSAKNGTFRAYAGDLQGGEILFWLKKEVTQQPDPTVLPTQEALGQTVKTAVEDYADTLIHQDASAL